MDLLRDSSLGQLIRFFAGNQCLLHPEEQAGFTYPCNEEILSSEVTSPRLKRQDPALASSTSTVNNRPPQSSPTSADCDSKTLKEPSHTTPPSIDPEASTLESGAASQVLNLEADEGNEKACSLGVHKDFILVDWYDGIDTQNPQNWSQGKKAVVTSVLWLYTFTVYCASSIYTPSVEGVMKEYHVDQTLSSLGLSLYVLGYGIGPLVFSPISEIPRIGRNPPYMLSLFLYVLMAIPTALTRSFSGFLALRFLTGFLGSPCLATGGATLQDMYSPLKLPYGYTAWVGATFCAPALGPVISAFAISANGYWRWPLWEILWMAVFTFLVMFVAFPETSAPTILFYRARRIRKRFRDQRYISQAEIDEASLSPRQVITVALIRPFQISLLDPAVLFANVYSSYSYGVYYSFFEAFPLVYTDIYGFNLGFMSTAFLSIVVACFLGTLVYLVYISCYLGLKISKHGPGSPEKRLIPAIFASFLQPIGLFLFAWSSRQSIHWVVSMVGIILFSTGGFIVFQAIFMYLPLSYPRYAASLFAANDFCRSAWAAGAVLYARPLFSRLGIAAGVSLLGALSCGGVLGVSILYVYGAQLRARSKFAET